MSTERKKKFLVDVAYVAVILALSMLINFLTGEGGVTDTQYYISLAVILLIAGAAYAGSCFLSALIYEKAEL